MDPERWRRKREKFERNVDRWERHWERKRYYWRSPARPLFSGIVFVTIGLVFLLGNMGLMNLSYILRFWPVILIAGGVFKLVEGREDYGHSSGIFWIVVGGLFLLGSIGILRVAFRDFWPVVLIGFGSLMLWRSAFIARERRSVAGNRETSRSFSDSEPIAGSGSVSAESDHSSGASSNSILSAMAILGSVERRNNSQDFRGGSATAVMGRCEIDLRAASITSSQEPVLEVFAMWGGIEIRVPPDWTIVSRVDPILGGYDDSTQPPKEESKRVVIRGAVIMGGIEVTN
jgi:predicted membrane protein